MREKKETKTFYIKVWESVEDKGKKVNIFFGLLLLRLWKGERELTEN